LAVESITASGKGRRTKLVPRGTPFDPGRRQNLASAVLGKASFALGLGNQPNSAYLFLDSLVLQD